MQPSERKVLRWSPWPFESLKFPELVCKKLYFEHFSGKSIWGGVVFWFVCLFFVVVVFALSLIKAVRHFPQTLEIPCPHCQSQVDCQISFKLETPEELLGQLVQSCHFCNIRKSWISVISTYIYRFLGTPSPHPASFTANRWVNIWDQLLLPKWSLGKWTVEL